MKEWLKRKNGEITVTDNDWLDLRTTERIKNGKETMQVRKNVRKNIKDQRTNTKREKKRTCSGFYSMVWYILERKYEIVSKQE